MNMIVSLQDNQGGTTVQIKATHDQIPAMLHEIAGRIIDWRTESLTIRPDAAMNEMLANQLKTPFSGIKDGTSCEEALQLLDPKSRKNLEDFFEQLTGERVPNLYFQKP